MSRGRRKSARGGSASGAGNLKAHFALGYTLSEQGRFQEAYRHLRLYTELAPHNAWAWNWFGQSLRGSR